VVGVSRTRSRDLVVTAFRRPHDGDFSGGGGGSRINAPRASRLTDTGSDLSVLGSERPPPTSAEQTGSPSTRHSATPLRDTGPAASSIASERPVRSDNIADSDAPVYGTDPEASNEVARTISERGTDEAMRLADELAEVNERLATLRQADSISPREQEIMAEADIKAQNLEQTAALYRAASICLTGGT